MTQQQIDVLTQEEYNHFLAYGDPVRIYADSAVKGYVNVYNFQDLDQLDKPSEWISTLVSTTFPDMTFGYTDVPCMSTVVC